MKGKIQLVEADRTLCQAEATECYVNPKQNLDQSKSHLYLQGSN